MSNSDGDEMYRVWAHDNQVYGPIDLPVLIQWTAEGRVLGRTWIYLETANEWRPARNIEVLKDRLPPGEETDFLQRQATEGSGISPQELRQIAILSPLSNQALARLIQLGELQCPQPGETVITKGAPGDAVFFVLAGTLRARLLVGLEDRTLARLTAGEVFGEMAMFTQSSRSADVVAEQNARLLRLGADRFRQLIGENPEAAAPMLFAIARLMANRIRDHNARFQREVASEFLWR